MLVVHRFPELVLCAAQSLVDAVEAFGHFQHDIAGKTVAYDHVGDLS